MSATCKASAYSGGWPRDCHRPATHGELCAPHAAGKKRSEAASVKAQVKWDAKSKAADEKRDARASLTAAIEACVAVPLAWEQLNVLRDAWEKCNRRLP